MEDSAMRAIPLLEEYFPGSVIGGKYQLEVVVGRGGMGSVWRANNVVLEMPVAIKLIRPAARDDETTASLLHEARLAARLQHPSVVRLFDFGVADTGDAYIVMELLKGSSLADLLERHGTLPAIAAVRVLLPIVHGLSAAHRTGIVHLDLKPENIVISETGVRWQPKLLDFGIAKRAGLRNNAQVSRTLVGSPAYMSPEQACGSRDIDARADVWGLCVVLYELVTGRAPFLADTASETLRAVVEREPAPFDGDDVGTRALWPIVQEGLAKDRRHRLASARRLGDALAQWLIERDVHDDVCGDLLASNWGPRARARMPSMRLHAASTELAMHEAPVVRRAPALRRRTAWAGAAACLSVAGAALVLLHIDAEGRGHLRKPVAVHARHRETALSSKTPEPVAAVAPQLTAAQSRDGAYDRQAPARASAASSAKLAPASTEQRAPERVTKLSSKRTQRARSREAELGLKDPFE